MKTIATIKCFVLK